MSRLIIIGASGHGKVVADIAKLTGYNDIVFLDDDSTKETCFGYDVIGPVSIIDELQGDIFVAVGDGMIRKKLIEKNINRRYPVLVHPSAVIASDVAIGYGSVVMAGAVINPGTIISNGCIINTCASVDHDCIVGAYSHVSVGAHLAGTVNIGENVWIGAGATVSNNLCVCSSVMIGAGAVVIKSIEREGVYVGVPAKPIKLY